MVNENLDNGELEEEFDIDEGVTVHVSGRKVRVVTKSEPKIVALTIILDKKKKLEVWDWWEWGNG